MHFDRRRGGELYARAVQMYLDVEDALPALPDFLP
jgi:hypothetical protein